MLDNGQLGPHLYKFSYHSGASAVFGTHSGQTALLLLGVIRNDKPHITPAISVSGLKAYLRVVHDPGLTVP